MIITKGEYLLKYFTSKPTIVITLDYTLNNSLSFVEMKAILEKGGKEFSYLTTCCTQFFSNKLTEGYDVFALRSDKSYIHLNKVIESKGIGWCDREYRMSHNAEKMLLTGQLKWRSANE